MAPKIDAPVCLPPADLQSIAESVHLAIRLLDDAHREAGTALGDEDTATYLFFRVEAVRDALSPAMARLAEYMPKPIGASGADLQPPSFPILDREIESLQNPRPTEEVTGLSFMLDQEREREDAEAALDDDSAKLWPGGYDNL